MKKISYIIIGFIFILAVVIIFFSSRNIKVDLDTEINNIDISKADNVMIVAHPDDETIWGGAHLIRDNYLVICITCGTNNTRVKEIKSVLKETNDQLIMLGYPDKVNGQRSDWKNDKTNILSDLKRILSLKKWNLIVTHNAEGEYGHEHHKMTHSLVLDAYNDLNLNEDLYFFGKYYSKKKMEKLQELPPSITEEELKEKERLIDLYKSQDFVTEKFGQMFKYEDWIKNN
jgi:LmbE family N-acetylglucosaminyl deacetylase